MECASLLHRLHMCALATAENADLLEELARDPTVACENCGARAKEAKNLCSPRPLLAGSWPVDGGEQGPGS
jgi:predicted nucleic acid-binding Zn ribbon protein